MNMLMNKCICIKKLYVSLANKWEVIKKNDWIENDNCILVDTGEVVGFYQH